MAQERNAHSYAQALLELATEPWLKGLRLANRRLREQGLVARLEDPALSMADKTKLLTTALGDMSPQVNVFVRSLVNEGELNKLDTIVAEFETLIVRRSQYVLAHVRSAVALQADDKKTLEENLARRFGATLEAEYEVDPSLLGGIVVRIGDEVIDGSLAGKLSVLRGRLAAS
jgi:F-type H+-transporting ATPase subunit delta